MPPKPTPIADKLWPKISDGAPAECWPWIGALYSNGYGHIRDRGKDMLAHRAVYQLTHGPIPEGLHVLHACDNPRCCNPAHLSVGTRSDNMRDCVAKGRFKKTGRH